MKKAQIEVKYEDHMGSDLSVVNAARQSFAKQKTVFDETTDGGLIQFLATGKRTSEWDDFLVEITRLSHAVVIGRDGAKEQLKQRLIEYKREAQHWAPFGHPHVTLRLRMPIFLARQFVKHQVGGVWSEESRRYVSDEPEFYFEPVLMKRPDDIKQGAAGELSDQHYALGVTWTGSLLFWSRVCNQRLDNHAQKAAQTLASQISDIIEPLFPVSWKALVK